MLKRVALVALALLAVLLLVVASRPGQLHVERSLSVAAPPEVVFPLINDFRAWPSWSPWEKLDPEMRRDLSAVSEGKGATYAWAGNDQVGVGNMEITESAPPHQLRIRLEFKEPWAATNTTTFTVDPSGKGSRVTWAMDGENNFGAKAMSLFMDMDQMIGKDFEAGLTNLGAMAEGAAEMKRAAAAAPPPVPQNVPAAVGSAGAPGAAGSGAN
jgi:uncharacterized protein YndB with AHSA1/START domain